MRFQVPTLPRLLTFFCGMIIMSLGYALLIQPGLGAAPWDVLHLGLEKHLRLENHLLLPLGTIILIASLLVLLFNLFLAIYPSVGMVLNILVLGPMMQVALALLPTPTGMVARVLMAGSGILIAGIGVAIYISAGLGSGPRDGMMLGLSQRLKLRVGPTKNGIDVLVCLIGWRLGGQLGIGTVLAALLTGPAVQLGYYLVRRLARVPAMETFLTVRSDA